MFAASGAAGGVLFDCWKFSGFEDLGRDNEFKTELEQRGEDRKEYIVEEQRIN